MTDTTLLQGVRVVFALAAVHTPTGPWKSSSRAHSASTLILLAFARSMETTHHGMLYASRGSVSMQACSIRDEAQGGGKRGVLDREVQRGW